MATSAPMMVSIDLLEAVEASAAVDRVDGAAVKDVADEQLGLRLIARRIEEIDRGCGGEAEQRQDRDHFLVPEERKKKIVASETRGRHRF